MKKMTCHQLGGACDIEFEANSFDEMANLSKEHAMEMFAKGDEGHLAAMSKMQELMKKPDEMKAWFESKKQLFDSLPSS